MESYSINPADIVVIGIVLLSALIAFARGMVREVLSVAGWVGASFATIYGLPLFRGYARHFISNPTMANAAAGLVIFIVALLVLSVVSGQLARLVRGSALSAVDRSLGFVFGLARGAIFVCLAYLMVSWVLPATDQPLWLRQARTLPVIQEGANLLKTLVPADTRSGALADVDASVKAAEEQATAAANAAMLQRLSTPVPSAAAPGAAAPGPAPSGPAPSTSAPSTSAPSTSASSSPAAGSNTKKPDATAKNDGGYSDRDNAAIDQLIESTNHPVQ